MREQAADAGSACAVAYLGFAVDARAENFSAEAVYGAFPEFDGATFVDAGGDDVYALVPADSGAAVTIARAELDENGALAPTGETLYAGGGAAVILRCNVSDIVPNTLVTITGSAGSIYAASPSLSLRDGRVAMAGAYDFTEYPGGTEPEG